MLPQFGSRESTRWQATAKGMLTFELKSLIGRAFYRRKPRPTNEYLHVGCGRHIVAGFENLDFYALQPRALALPVTRHDLRYPLPYSNSIFEGAFSQHCIEHLYPDQAIRLMAELHRVLRPGGVLRISVPDLGKYIQYYTGKATTDEFAGRYRTGHDAIWSLTQSWGHVSLWDADTLTSKLRGVGFSEATQVGFGEGRSPKLLIDQPDREWETLYVEAVR